MGLFERWNNIIYIWANGMLDTTSDAYRNLYSPKQARLKWKLVFKELTADFLRMFRSTRIEKSKIWFLAFTQNNYEALKDLQKGVPDSIFISFFRFRSTITKETRYFNLPLKFLYHLVFPFTFILYALSNRKKALKHYDLLVAINGSYEECLRLLRRKRPEAIIFSNDHLIMARAMLLAANNLGIKTYYVQHACVSEYFPPLEFTHALLEGKDALEKYRKCGPVRSKVYLVGMSKFDRYIHQLNKHTKVDSVGIPFNISDDIASVYLVARAIRQGCPDLKVVIRPHPEDRRKLSIFDDFDISIPANESAFQFLTTVDCILSSDSSIHLEAALLNVYPLYFNFNGGTPWDYYGFVAKGLVDFCEDLEQLQKTLIELRTFKPNIQTRTVDYNAAINADFYGKTTQKIIDIVLETVNLNDVQ